jgi:ligand-binding sensor domain-containing protein
LELRRYAALLGVAAGLCLPSIALGQPAAFNDPEYLTTVWQTEEGLPDSSATAMVQTPDGYLWVGTFNGLARFDGLQWRVFNHDNTPELPSSEIIKLHLDRLGRLWVSTTAGMACVRDGTWQVYRHGSGWKGDFARHFAEAPDGAIYVTTFDGKLLHFREGGFEELPPPPGDPGRKGVFPHVDPAGVLWAYTPGFLGRFIDGAWKATIPVERWEQGDFHLGSSRDGGLWILTAQRLRKVQGERLVLEVPGPAEKVTGTWQVYEDSTGTLWVCTFAGLERFTPGQGWRHFSARTGLAHDNVRTAFEDREGNVWIGTNGGGVQRFRRRLFTSWGRIEGLPEPIVRTVAADARGRIAFGMQGQGAAFLESGRLTHLSAGTPTAGAYVYSVLVDRNDRLWIGTWASGLWISDRGRLRQLGDESGPLFTNKGEKVYVFSLFEDSRGRVWIGSNHGLTRFEDDAFETYGLDFKTALHSIRAIAEDPRTGEIWAGHHTQGLYVLRGGLLVHAPGTEALQRDHVSSLLFDRDGTLWIGTEDHGLACLRDGKLRRISDKEGLTARIGALLDDGKGSLWIGSSSGVLRVRRTDLDDVVEGRSHTLAHETFGPQDGLGTAACSLGVQPAATIDPRGRLWFATNKGVSVVDPSQLRTNRVPPQMAIQDVWVDGDPVTIEAPFRTSTAEAPPARIRIPAGTRRLEIHYAGLSFSVPEKVRFRYALEGLDDEWIDVALRTAYLQNLAPGQYHFKVKAANNDGVWSEQAAQLDLEMLPHFYQTRTFLAACVALIAVAIAAGYRARVRRFRAREGELKAQVHTLSGLLPICASCKKIRDDTGYWNQMEIYVREHSQAEFSHSICPDCMKTLYPDYVAQNAADDEDKA